MSAADAEAEQANLLRRSSWIVTAALVLLGATVLILYRLRAELSLASDHRLANAFAYYQDLPVTPIVLACLVLVALVGMRGQVALPSLGRRAAVGTALLVFLLAYAGTYALFGGFHLSLDEFMADFDMRILREGQLLAPLPPDWRDLRDALQPMFLLKVEGAQFWSSGYLPGNAALRALFDMLGDAALTAPFEAAASALLLPAIALKLRPGDRGFAFCATLLFITSSQFLVTAMTAYAMTGHLALNLAWLWLFLHDRGWSRVAVLPVTFLATGLHQVPFHPLFVAPFLLWLLLERRWLLALYYGAVVAAAALFWIFYWEVALAITGARPEIAGAVGGGFFVDRVLAMVETAFRPVSMVFTADNLLRLLTWQNPLVWPLALVAVARLRRQPSIAWPLLGGLLITMAAVLVLMPYQGHGWGYRYLHGLLGNLALLAALGWRTLVPASAGDAAAVSRVLLLSAAFSLLILLPIRGVQANRFAAPYRAADAAISRIETPLVIVDPDVAWFSQDMFRNDPYLRNRPIRIVPNEEIIRRARRLCRNGQARFVHHLGPELSPLRMTGPADAREGAERRIRYFRQLGCRTRFSVSALRSRSGSS